MTYPIYVLIACLAALTLALYFVIFLLRGATRYHLRREMHERAKLTDDDLDYLFGTDEE